MTEPTNENLFEGIRKRPAMYLGGTEAVGLHHLLFWAIDDIVANARAGRGNAIWIGLNTDGSCFIADEGSWWNTLDRPILEALERQWFAQGVVDRGTIPQFQLCTYLPLIAALSKRTTIWSPASAAHLVSIHWTDGRMSLSENTIAPDEFDETFGTRYGNVVRFWPDPEIFGYGATWDPDIIRTRLQDASACSGIEAFLRVPGERASENLTMDDGMSGIVRRTAARVEKDARTWATDPYPGGFWLFPERPLRLRVHQDDLSFDIALQWDSGLSWQEKRPVLSWANTVRTTEGGSHVIGLRDALRALRLDDLNLLAAISVFVPHPRFVSPTKGCLRNPEIRTLVRDHLRPTLQRFREQDDVALAIERLRAIP